MNLYKYLFITILIWNNLCSTDITNDRDPLLIPVQKSENDIPIEQAKSTGITANINLKLATPVEKSENDIPIEQVGINIYTRNKINGNMELKNYENISERSNEITNFLYNRFVDLNLNYNKEIVKEKLVEYVLLFRKIQYTLVCGLNEISNTSSSIVNSNIFSANFSKIEVNIKIKNGNKEINIEKDLIRYSLIPDNLNDITIIIYNNKLKSEENLIFYSGQYNIPCTNYSDKNCFWLAESAIKDGNFLAIDLNTNKSKFISLWDYDDNSKLCITYNEINPNIDLENLYLHLSRQILDNDGNPVDETKLGDHWLSKDKTRKPFNKIFPIKICKDKNTYSSFMQYTNCNKAYKMLNKAYKMLNKAYKTISSSNINTEEFINLEIPIKRNNNTSYFPSNKRTKTDKAQNFTSCFFSYIADLELNSEQKQEIIKLIDSSLFISRALAVTTSCYYFLNEYPVKKEKEVKECKEVKEEEKEAEEKVSYSDNIFIVVSDKKTIDKMDNEVAWGNLDMILINDKREGGSWSFKNYELDDSEEEEE